MAQPITTYGDVPKSIQNAVSLGVGAAFGYADYHGAWPEIHVSEGPLLLPNGDRSAPACYSDRREWPMGKIHISVSSLRENVIRLSAVPLEPIAFAFAARIALEHVERMHKGYGVEAQHQEANRIAEYLTLLAWRVSFSFTNEVPVEGGNVSTL